MATITSGKVGLAPLGSPCQLPGDDRDIAVLSDPFKKSAGWSLSTATHSKEKVAHGRVPTEVRAQTDILLASP